jgi:hypothetical protein
MQLLTQASAFLNKRSRFAIMQSTFIFIFIVILTKHSYAIDIGFGGGDTGGTTTLGVVPDHIKRQNIEERLTAFGYDIPGDSPDISCNGQVNLETF